MKLNSHTRATQGIIQRHIIRQQSMENKEVIRVSQKGFFIWTGLKVAASAPKFLNPPYYGKKIKCSECGHVGNQTWCDLTKPENLLTAVNFSILDFLRSHLQRFWVGRFKTLLTKNSESSLPQLFLATKHLNTPISPHINNYLIVNCKCIRFNWFSDFMMSMCHQDHYKW